MAQRGFVRKRGRTWTAYWHVDAAGGSRQRSKGGFLTRGEAQAYLTETLAAIRAGLFTEVNRITLGEYLLERWLPSRKPALRPSTYDRSLGNIRLHIAPALGHVRLQQLTVDHLDQFYASQLSEGNRSGVRAGLSPKSVRYLHTILHRALRDAMRKNLVVRNVADAADPPKLRRPAEGIRTWSASQLRDFLDATTDHPLGVVFLVAATTGMRRGEVLGLRWMDVDFDVARLAVRQTILCVRYEIVVGSPKTARGNRSIAIDRTTVEALRRLRRGRATDPLDALVFARPDGRPYHPDYVSQTFDRTVARLGLPRIRLHDLRHTHATLGLAAGIPTKVMSDRLGHATTAFTQDVYMHAIPQLEADAAEQIAATIFATEPGDKAVTPAPTDQADG
jgi:integrase